MFDIQAVTIAPFKHEMYKKTVSDSIDDSYNEVCKIFDLLNIKNLIVIDAVTKRYIKINIESGEVTSNYEKNL